MKKLLVTVSPDSEVAPSLEQSGQFQINRIEQSVPDWIAGDGLDSEVLFCDAPSADFAQMDSV
ncbi:hypothetical protein N9B73_10875, partial [Verrucomicrobiales bacterium]|nr:hypothetical protein [Verrucomicrobiales bacterium]